MSAELRQVLGAWRFMPVHIPKKPEGLEKAAHQVAQQLGDVHGAIPNPANLVETRRILEAYWKRGMLGRLPRSHLRRSPHVLFLDPEPHLGADPDFVRAYLGTLQLRVSGRILSALLHVFFREYPVNKASFEILREGLRRMLERSATTARLQTWKERCAAYGLLEQDAVKRFAAGWAGHAEPSSYLGEVGFTGDLATRGLVIAAFDHLLQSLGKALEQTTGTPELLDSVLRIAIDEEGRIRFPDRRAALAEALLLPFENREQVSATTERIKAFLTRYYGHPRIKLANWRDVRPAAVHVFLRWSVRAALDTFFDVLDATAKAAHWRYRKAFWTAYLNQGYIDEAWIFLGRRARALVSQNLQEAEGSYGLYSGDQGNKSVLLMRIGWLTIAEQTHDGKCYIWPSNYALAPRLYEQEYHPNQRAFDEAFSVSHHGSQRGSWQAKIARHIADYTGIAVAPEEYMPAEVESLWG